MLFTITILTLAGLAKAQGSVTTSFPPFSATSSGCTTLNPIFGTPADGTGTVFATTETSTTVVNCRGCTPYTETFVFLLGGPIPLPTTTITIADTPTTSTIFECAPATPQGPTISSTISLVSTPTASPLPPISDTAQALIDGIRTAILYVSLIANGPFPDVLCTGLNPSVLSNNTGYNGTAVLTEVCFAAGIERVDPVLYPSAVTSNQAALKYLEQALFAVQFVSGYASVDAAPSQADVQKLCDEVKADVLNEVFGGYLGTSTGDRIKEFVCNAGGGGQRCDLHVGYAR